MRQHHDVAGRECQALPASTTTTNDHVGVGYSAAVLPLPVP